MDIEPHMVTLTVLPNGEPGRRSALRYLRHLQTTARGAKVAARQRGAHGRRQAEYERARAEARLMQWVYEGMRHGVYIGQLNALLCTQNLVRERDAGWPTYSKGRWCVTAQYLYETFTGLSLGEEDLAA